MNTTIESLIVCAEEIGELAKDNKRIVVIASLFIAIVILSFTFTPIEMSQKHQQVDKMEKPVQKMATIPVSQNVETAEYVQIWSDDHQNEERGVLQTNGRTEEPTEPEPRIKKTSPDEIDLTLNEKLDEDIQKEQKAIRAVGMTLVKDTFAQIDTDMDGMITTAELEDNDLFDLIDRDHDEIITPEELLNSVITMDMDHTPERRRFIQESKVHLNQSTRELLTALDIEKDGFLSQSELSMEKQEFGSYDKDKDDLLSASELKLLLVSPPKAYQ